MGRLLQILGCVLMLAAVSAAVGGANRADAEILAPIARAIQAALAIPQNATPAPGPSPTPTPKPKGARVQHGGPLEFNLSGSLSLGESSTTSSLGGGVIFTPSPSPNASSTPGPFPFQQPSQTSQSQADIGAGITADVSRRTATTMTDLKIPVGFSVNGQSAIGYAQFIYSTPKYSLGYGSQQLLALGQLQMGYTLRGFSFILPQRYGQTTFFEGPALGVDQELVRLDGILAQQVRAGALYEGGFVYANGPLTGRAKTVEFGTARSGRNLDLILEGAWQTRSGGDGNPHGIATQLRLDDFAQGGGCSTTLRGVPDQFVSFSAGEIYSDRFADFNCHGSRIPAYFDLNWEKTGDPIFGVNQQSVATLGYSPTMKLGGLSFNLVHQTGSSVGESLLSNVGSVALSTQFFGTSALIGGQIQHTDDAGSLDTMQSLSASLRHAIGHHLSVGVTGQIQRQSLLAASPSPDAMATPFVTAPTLTLQKGISFDVAQQFRKTTVQFGETITRTISDTSDAIQHTPLINLTRQISPVISVTTSFGYQTLRDSINPAVDGHTRVFSIALSAPFSYGNANVAGRIDPHLPATITGKVLLASSNATGQGAASNFATFAGTGGVANVLVTLDGKIVQRTDVSGGFQFSFVTPGQHQITIDNSSIPRGFTAAVPVQTVVVEGGQMATVSFSIGTFGGILGHVYGSDSSGNPLPLSNVQLRVDGGAYSQTDTSGAYGFGGLSAGQHEVAVIPQSIPASADFSPADLIQKVTVSDGRYTTLDFHAQLLGSIAGTIVYAKDMDKQAGLGVLNAYVVAEPGEHAAIDQDDGSFIIDNLPGGDYTVSADPETIGQGLGAAPDTITVHLAPGEHYKGIQFLVGRFEKKVVFSLLAGGATPAPAVPEVRLSETRLPPRGTTYVAIDAPEIASDVFAVAFGKRVNLTFDKASQRWTGEVEVPEKAGAGEYPVSGSVHGAPVPKAATLTVDPKLPLAIVQYSPRNAPVGATVTVRARFLVDVHAGQTITWSDGTTTVLDKPITGRVFTFRKLLTLLPLHGLLLTPKGTVPIVLL
ncbi:MAG TPA: carboxypeptidase-like regulatory domain-containing protein [Candidatus Acidoferrum sp.]|nr:carboxypeptidase-like regulatory domain-containing protein [Candidatus Acidoferrum sp.]